MSYENPEKARIAPENNVLVQQKLENFFNPHFNQNETSGRRVTGVITARTISNKQELLRISTNLAFATPGDTLESTFLQRLLTPIQQSPDVNQEVQITLPSGLGKKLGYSKTNHITTLHEYQQLLQITCLYSLQERITTGETSNIVRRLILPDASNTPLIALLIEQPTPSTNISGDLSFDNLQEKRIQAVWDLLEKISRNSAILQEVNRDILQLIANDSQFQQQIILHLKNPAYRKQILRLCSNLLSDTRYYAPDSMDMISNKDQAILLFVKDIPMRDALLHAILQTDSNEYEGLQRLLKGEETKTGTQLVISGETLLQDLKNEGVPFFTRRGTLSQAAIALSLLNTSMPLDPKQMAKAMIFTTLNQDYLPSTYLLRAIVREILEITPTIFAGMEDKLQTFLALSDVIHTNRKRHARENLDSQEVARRIKKGAPIVIENVPQALGDTFLACY